MDVPLLALGASSGGDTWDEILVLYGFVANL